MTEESRGKRRKQANPRRNRVEVEQLNPPGSEEDDEVCLWSLETQDCQESLDKSSVTPSEVTEEPGSPAFSARPCSLSPGSRTCWGQVESEAPAEEDDAYAPAHREGGRDLLRMYCKNSESQNALDEIAHFELVAQLRKASTSANLLDHLSLNGSCRPSSRHDELPPAIWSPGAQHCSPEGADAVRSQQACPFCHRMFQRGASLRDHVKNCQEREGGHLVCPLCGYTATLRSQMERHLALHNQMQDKSAMGSEQTSEMRKFKCLECGKAFKYKHHLKEHLRIHSGEKPYECSNCKKRFSHSGSYSSHLSSKKCLGGGGNAGVFNGQSSHHHHSLPVSPSAGGGSARSINDKGSFVAVNQDSVRPLDHSQQLQDLQTCGGSFPVSSELPRLWECSPGLSLGAGIIKGSPLVPHLPSATKFEHMLQEMLHREANIKCEAEDAQERMGVQNGGGAERQASPNRRRSEDVFGVMCRWCSQVFPNVASLLLHEQTLCRVNRDAAEVPEGFQSKGPSSPTPFLPRSTPQPENTKTIKVPNGFSGTKSPLQKHGWLSVPQQLLVAMQSPPPPPPHPHIYLSSHEKGSPNPMMAHSPDMPSPRSRRRASSLEFGSPVPGTASPQKDLGSPWCAQNEPLDLSLPKLPAEPMGRQRTTNGLSGRAESRELRTTRPTSHLPLHQYPLFTGTGPSVFPGSVYNGFPFFSQSGLAVHDSMTPFGRTASGPGFLSPVAYMMEADAEAVLKKIYHERHSLMGEALHRNPLDYLSLTDEGFESEGGPGRKRLKKTDEGLYACDICEKTFQKSSSLLRHKYEHTGKRPHECKICNKAFKHKHHLIEHSRLHSGEKPYQCDKCGKRFSHSGSYSQHMNHRYAYCSKDQDLDQDQEEMPLTPGAGSSLTGSLAEDKPPSVDDAKTIHSFLSDSSLDESPDALRGEEGEEEEEEEEGGSGRYSPNHESPIGERQQPNQLNNGGVGNHVSHTESHVWNGDMEDENGDLNKCELSLDRTELPRIKT